MKVLSRFLFVAVLMLSVISFNGNAEANTADLKDGFYVATPKGYHFFTMSDLLNPNYIDTISDAFDYGFQYVYLYESGEVINIYDNMVSGKDFEAYTPGAIPAGDYKDLTNKLVPVSGGTSEADKDFTIVDIY